MSEVKDIRTVDDTTYPYIFEQDVSVPLKAAGGGGVIRANVYRPKPDNVQSPVIITYGPYGKDIPYEV